MWDAILNSNIATDIWKNYRRCTCWSVKYPYEIQIKLKTCDHMKKIILLIPKISYEEVKSIYEKWYKYLMSKQDLEKTFNPF